MEQYAKQNQMLLLLEPLNFTESNILQTIGEAQDMLQALGSPHVKLVVDYYHFQMQNEPLDALRAAKEQVYHLHFGMPPKRVYPTELLDEYRRLFRGFRRAFKHPLHERGSVFAKPLAGYQALCAGVCPLPKRVKTQKSLPLLNGRLSFC